MHDVAAHLRQHWLQLPEQVVGGADHEGQGAGCRAPSTTGNRGVGQGNALLGRLGGDQLRGLRVDGAAIDGRGAGTNAGQHAVFVQVNATHMSSGRQHGDDQFTALRCLTRGGAEGAAQFLELGQHRGVQIEHVQRVPGLDQVARHRRAHVAQADKCDTHVGSP
ncbi:hypothetical protein D3C80_1287570 [compost metagenome]